jgi:hypothetical protein
MGQARARAREIAELKRLGVRRVDTPWADRPVLTVMRGGYNGLNQDTWMILDTEFQAELDRLRSRELDRATLEGTIMGLARMALWAERSGVKEEIAQNWYALQQRELHDRIKQAQTDARPVVAETRVLAKKRRKGKTDA